MTEDFTTEALAFLLEELEPARRARFEERLTRDPVAAAAFKTCADSLAEFALAEAPAARPTARERERSLEGALALAGPQSRRPGFRIPPAFWPMAAAALLVLNLALTALVVRERPQAGRRAAESAAPARTLAPAAHPFAAGSALADGTAAPSKINPADPGREVKRELDRLAALRLEYARLRERRDALNLEYQGIVRQLEDAALLESGANRIVAVQLIDGQSYAKGTRNPSLDLSQSVMTGPGVMAAGALGPENSVVAPKSSIVGTVPTTMSGTITGAGLEGILPEGASILTWNGPALSSTAGGIADVNVSDTAVTSTSAVTSSTPVPPPTDPAAAASPNAWSIYDEAAHQGYLDLYNLPTVTSDQALELWVQPLGSSSFLPVGAIPSQYYGASGSVYYKLPSDSVTPGDIMITIEPKGVFPTVPTGTTVLRGP